MTNQVSGILLSYFAEAVLITLLGSAILLLWYRRAVIHGMRAAPGAVAAPPPPAAPPPALSPSAAPPPGGRMVARARLRLVAVYGVAGMLAAGLLAALFLSGLGEPPRGIQILGVWYVYCWPLVPAYAALLALSRRGAIWLTAGYMTLGAAIILAWSVVSLLAMPEQESTPLRNVLLYLGFLGVEAAPPFLIILALSSRRLRSVSSFVLAGLLVFSFSNLAVTNGLALSLDVPALRAVGESLGADSYVVGWFMLAALPIGFLC